MTQSFLTGANGLRLGVDIVGKGPDVLLLHGGGQTRGSWRRTAQLLADRGYRAIAYDARGHGTSDWAEDGYRLPKFAADLRQVLADLDSRPAVIGASLGGMTGLLALGQEPKCSAAALVLVDIAPKTNPKGGQRIARFMTANQDGFASVEEAADAVSLYMTERPRPRDISGLRRNLRERDGRFFWHWDPRLFPADVDPQTLRESHEVLGAAAQGVEVPTLMVRGKLSELVDDESMQDFLRLMPAAEVAEVEGAGHMVAGDANTPFADAVIDFLSRVYPAG